MIVPEHHGDDDFRSTLERFEHSLVTPVVPGELPAWLEAAHSSCKEIGEPLRHVVEEAHPDLLREIARQDIELTPRIEELKTKDEAMIAEWNTLCRALDELRQRADRTEPNEAKLDAQVERLREKCLHFVIEARKQDAALATWLVEAFNRDRGIAD
jgi:hypothetical protein